MAHSKRKSMDGFLIPRACLKHAIQVKKTKSSRKQKVQFNVILHKNLKDQQLKNDHKEGREKYLKHNYIPTYRAAYCKLVI